MTEIQKAIIKGVAITLPGNLSYRNFNLILTSKAIYAINAGTRIADSFGLVGAAVARVKEGKAAETLSFAQINDLLVANSDNHVIKYSDIASIEKMWFIGGKRWKITTKDGKSYQYAFPRLKTAEAPRFVDIVNTFSKVKIPES